MLQPGQNAPQFALPDADMEMFELDSLRGRQHAVLFFYPRDDSPLCTLEAIDFSDHEDDFNRLGCAVVGVSRDDFLRHSDFRDKHGLSIRLLSDENGEVCRKYGVCKIREKEGHRKLCVVHATFIIDRRGIIRHVFYDISPKGHVAEVFQRVKDLAKEPEGSGKTLCKSKKIPSSH
ncbi:MAG: peroxiredoxin [Rhodocyclaceae bacterium]|nr:peroxiredoxin [Rhodocyclaceae bacterium]